MDLEIRKGLPRALSILLCNGCILKRVWQRYELGIRAKQKRHTCLMAKQVCRLSLLRFHVLKHGLVFLSNQRSILLFYLQRSIFIQCYRLAPFIRSLKLFVSYRLLNCLKCLVQIFDDIINVLCTDRKTNGVWLNSLVCQFCF